ncbi:MAG: PAS domain-containing protein [Bacteroidales bacterium]|nr:PAS domain-containing protein [Bacteroidales bacterium]
MNSWQFTPIAILYFIAALISFSLSIFVWKMRDVNGKTYFRFLNLFTGIWTLAYALMVFSTNIMMKLIMLRISYLGLICSVVFWLFFVLSYTNSDNWLSKWMKGLILIIPVLSFIQILTFQYHRFYYTSYEFTEVDGLFVLVKEYGPGFYIWVLYSYIILIAGGIILIRGIINMPIKFRRQIFVIIFILLIIFIPNLLYNLGINPIAPYEPTSLSFVLIGIGFFSIIHFDKFLNIVPVAYNLVFRSTKSGVIIINEQGVIIDINASAEQIFNFNLKEIVGNNILDLMHDYKAVYEQLLVDQEFKAEIYNEKNNRHYEIITDLLYDYNKKIIGRILMFYDVTDRKQAILELDAYARTVAHDLKNPMNTILGFTAIFKEYENLNDKQREFTNYIHESANKMHDIIEGLLLLARVRNNKDIKTSSLEMDVIIEKVLYRLEDLIKQTNGNINYNNKWPLSVGYPIWIEEVWVNYISNALKYSGSPPYVELGATEMKDSIKFWVKDNGKGLTIEEKKDLFNEFSQLESRKNDTEGHGLGLSIVKRIVTKLDGNVGIETEIGSGCTFFFTLPKVKKEAVQ